MFKIVDSRTQTHLYETLRGYKRGLNYHVTYLKQMKKYLNCDFLRPIICYQLRAPAKDTFTWEEIDRYEP